MSWSKTKPTKWLVHPAKIQISLGICPVWSESLLSAWRSFGSLATQRKPSEDCDQTRRMPRLIWVFPGPKGHIIGFVVLWLNIMIFWGVRKMNTFLVWKCASCENVQLFNIFIKSDGFSKGSQVFYNFLISKALDICKHSSHWARKLQEPTFYYAEFGVCVLLWGHFWNANEPQHDKTNKMTCAPSKDSDQPGHPPSICCPHEETLGP